MIVLKLVVCLTELKIPHIIRPQIDFSKTKNPLYIYKFDAKQQHI